MFRIFYCFLAALARLAVRSGRSKDLVIIVLRHQLQVLGRHIDRPAVNDNDRTLLAAIAAALPRQLRHGWIVCSSSTSRPARCSSLVLPRTPPAPGPPKQPATCFSAADQLDAARALVRDRDSQFIGAFDEIFRADGFKILTTPVRTPVANTFAERWIGSIRRELLDRTIIGNQRQLKRLIVDYIAH